MDRRILFLFVIFSVLCFSIKLSEDTVQTQGIFDRGILADIFNRSDARNADYSAEQTEELQSTEQQTTDIRSLSAEETSLTTISDAPGIRVVLSKDHEGKIPSDSITICWTADTTFGERTYPAGSRTFTSADLPSDGLCITSKGELSLTFDVKLDERKFSGKLYLYPYGQKLYAVNEISLEEYVACVVPGEMPSYYPKEALKAQAICARTYALCHLKSAEEYHADVGDSVSWQVFNNAGRKESTDKATEETKGQVIMTGNKPSDLYFYSTSCGFTGRDDVWYDEPRSLCLKSVYLGEGKKTLKSEHDFVKYISREDKHAWESGEDWFRWHTTFSQEQLVALCQKRDETVSEVISMQVTKRSSGYAALELVIDCGEKTMKISGEYEIREFLSPEGTDLTNQSEVQNDRKILPSGYFVLDPVYEQGSLVEMNVYGGGLGHGAGMSQNGAKRMAEAGINCKEILATFFDIS